MKNILHLLVLLPLLVLGQAQSVVVGGIDVDIDEYPWQTALTSSPNGSGFCGGSIIANSWVLTAAHCVNGDSPNNLFIRCGTSSSFASGGDSYSVKQIIVHPSYNNPVSMAYDFALVEIDDEFLFNENVAKIDLINQTELLAGAESPGVRSTITGWGTTSSGGSLASVLQMASATIVSNAEACGSSTDVNGDSGAYPCGSLHESMICAGDLIDGGEDACQGDSGGPLTVISPIDNRWLLVGVTSWGYGCADVNYPGIWSRVSSVLDWIEEIADMTEELIVPDLFDVNSTDLNHTVLLPSDMLFSLQGNSISNTDIIGVFYTDENEQEHCAGYTVWSGENDTIAVQGDDQNTLEIDGFTDSMEFSFKLWDASENELIDCFALYNSNLANQAFFTVNGLSELSKLQAIPLVNSQEIELVEGWSLFSTFLTLENMDVIEVISPIVSNVVVVKDFMGMAYLTEWGFNGIGTITLSQAYQIKTSTEIVLNLEGTYSNPNELIITLPTGWSLLGYLRTSPADCEAVFETISSEVSLVKDYLGNVYLPEWGFNSIGNMEPGTGYQVKMNSNQYFQFNSNLDGY
tara:strand:- start:957 stop:2684 length:1728 start_codon:yes stop_codon:yes gene_type:complete